MDAWGTSAQELLSPEDCTAVEVTDVVPKESGYVGVRCTLRDGSQSEFWINPQFLGCGDGTVLRTIAPKVSCTPQSASTRESPSELGETGGAEIASKLPVEAKPLLQIADKTLSVLATNAALESLSAGAQSPVHRKIAEQLKNEYELIQQARNNDFQLIDQEYAVIDEAGATQKLDNGLARLKSELKELESQVGETCDGGELLSKLGTTFLTQVNDKRKACSQHQDAIRVLEEWMASRPTSAYQFVKQLLPSQKGMKPTAEARARRLILLAGADKTQENVANKKFRYTIGVSAGDFEHIPYIHDGYLLGGSRREDSRGTDCSEFIFQALVRSCAPSNDSRSVSPPTRVFRKFALMLRGEIPWDENEVGVLAPYRSCFDSPEISHDTPPSPLDIIVSSQPGGSVGHMAWVLKYDEADQEVQTFEAAGGLISSAVSVKRPVYETTCSRTKNMARVPRADLVVLRLKAQLDSSCPLAQ